MALFLKLRSNRFSASGPVPGVVLVKQGASTGYTWRSPGALEGVLGSVVQQPVMTGTIDQFPVKSGQREMSREFSLLIEIAGTSWSNFTALRDALLAEIRDVNAYGGRLRYRANNGSQAFELGVQHVVVSPMHSHSTELNNRVTVELKLTCEPYAYGDPLDVVERFLTNTLTTGGVLNDGGADWTVRSGVAPTLSAYFTGGQQALFAAGSGSSVLEHSGTPYPMCDNQQVLSFFFAAFVTGNAAGCVLKMLPDGSHLRAIVEDNGSTATLKIQTVTSGGVATTLGTTVNTAARIQRDTFYTMKARIEGNVVVVECVPLASQPRPVQYPGAASAVFYAVTLAGADATKFGAGVFGTTGIFVGAPSVTGLVGVAAWSRYAFTYAGSTANGLGNNDATFGVTLPGNIPGTAPALVDVTASGVGGRAVVCAWTPIDVSTPSSSLTRPFGTVDVTAGTSTLSGLTVTADSGAAVGGSVALAGAGTSTITVRTNSRGLAPKDANDTVFMRVIARVRLASTLTTGTIGMTCQGSAPIDLVTRDLASWRPPSATRYELVNLGVVPVRVTNDGETTIVVTVTSGTASTVAVDYLHFAPIDRCAMSQTGVALSALPMLDLSGASWQVRSSLAGRSLAGGFAHGLWNDVRSWQCLHGNRIVVDSGRPVEWSIIHSSSPVDPIGSTSQQHASTQAYQFAVQPRYWVGA